MAPAAAHARPTYGMGDQNPASYEDQRLLGLHKLKTARYAVAVGLVQGLAPRTRC